MKSILIAFLALSTFTSNALTLLWTNTAGGDWSVPLNWFPNVSPAAGDSVLITNSGTYTVTFINTSSSIVLSNFTLGGSSGVQTLIIGNGGTPGLTVTNFAIVQANGVLSVTNGGIAGNLTIQTGGQLLLPGPGTMFLYNLDLINQGTVTWSGGLIETGGTIISNGTLWQITGDGSLDYGGGNAAIFTNSGIFRKTGGTGTSDMGPFDFINLPGGLVDAESGTMQFRGSTSNVFSGTFSAAANAKFSFFGGTWTDGGGSVIGSNQISGATIDLRTNTIPGLNITGGDIFITGTNTFQQAGAITNLTISGATLHGTNQVAGTLTFLTGALLDQTTILPTGQLVLGGSGGLLYTARIINQGIVNWTDGNFNVGGTPPTVISNGGVWLASSNNTLSFGGGATPIWTNSGTFHKTAGAGTSSLAGFNFINEPTGLVQADTGIISLPPNMTNAAGTLTVKGGNIQAAFGTPIMMTGGALNGTGSVGAIIASGGIISPGQSGTGLLTFTSGLTCSAGATISLDGTGLTPGTQYDQLSVIGSVALTNCALQITSLPTVALGTTFVIVTNDGTDAVLGTFAGLPNNSLFNAGGQSFRIHYNGGSGNDVTLVRDNTAELTGGKPGPTSFNLTGVGISSTLYTIQATTNFLVWTNIGTTISDPTGNINFTDSNASHFRYRFYRTTN